MFCRYSRFEETFLHIFQQIDDYNENEKNKQNYYVLGIFLQ